MKLQRFFCAVLAVLSLGVTGCNWIGGKGKADTSTSLPDPPLTEDSESQSKTEVVPMKKAYHILFIGNSYTYYNEMPTAIFESFAERAGYDLTVDSITNGGHKLSEFANPTDTYGAKVEQALTGSKKYDFVILQEQSVRPATENPSDFYSAVRNLTKRIRETGATPILYATWGRKSGNSTLGTYGWTNESMTWRLAAGYQAIGEELDISVAHVGLAFYDVYTGQSDIELYHSDGSHPSYIGSYLAAVTLFARMFHTDPTEVSYTGGLTLANANAVREAARKAVFDTPSIPAEYQTSSVGIGLSY